jgi:hypothetical protein
MADGGLFDVDYITLLISSSHASAPRSITDGLLERMMAIKVEGTTTIRRRDQEEHWYEREFSKLRVGHGASLRVCIASSSQFSGDCTSCNKRDYCLNHSIITCLGVLLSEALRGVVISRIETHLRYDHVNAGSLNSIAP